MSAAAAPVPPPDGSPDPGVPWHYGDPLREQRMIVEGSAVVDLSNRGVVAVTGPDRLTWLHSLTTQVLERLEAGQSALALILSPHGHVEHELHVVDDGATTWLIVQPGTAGALVDYLRSMQFMLRVEVEDRSATHAVVWEPEWAVDPDAVTWLVPADFAGRGHVESGSDRGGDAAKYVGARPADFAGPRGRHPTRAAGRAPVGGTRTGGHLGARGAARRGRGAAARPGDRPPHAAARGGLDRPRPCTWRRAATAARRPSRACTTSAIRRAGSCCCTSTAATRPCPSTASAVLVDGRETGWIGTPAWHYELGPIATASAEAERRRSDARWWCGTGR